jgi:hypothetical protein
MSRNWIMLDDSSDSHANRQQPLSEAENPSTQTPRAKRADLPRTPTEWAVAIALPAGIALLIVLAKLLITGR